MTAPGLEQRLGHSFAKPELLAHALTHRSSAGGAGSNERLEFLGDRVLGLCIAEWLSERYPTESEGALSKRLSSLVSREALAPIAEAIGLPAALKLPRAERRSGVSGSLNVLADAMEALLGAIYLDAGLDAARAVIRREWATAVERAAAPPVPMKTRLQEHTLGRGAGLPVYETVSATGPAHAPVFVVRVRAMGREAEGMGDTKRAAESAAAEAWLAAL
ncbi:ribonuclease III [Rhodovarius crocodyli]|uniref:Ribonuclease 3 n=1 Tax=Rhodovarius crocodyli TaxID=1979269 RepID=A0A437MIX8_9PROT|nr:ribonuclease III [Rhodovarius crocodyli]RVT97573.1 ribonuclease III [Rhodovarius crocodyli]